MTFRAVISRLFQQEDLNFLLTNRIPRRLLTQFMGWFSQIEQPLVRDLSIAAWKFFSDLDLSEAKKTKFKSLHDCFTRELKPGARTIDLDPALLVSPCDAIVGACGRVEDITVLQAKGFPYTTLFRSANVRVTNFLRRQFCLPVLQNHDSTLDDLPTVAAGRS